MESEYKANTSRMKKEFALQNARLRGDVESLNAALLARDRSNPITDHELESQFSDLAEEIDQLARSEWDFKQSEWTDSLLNQFSKNLKRRKKELLQDSLWMILYENIFCCPFRDFLEEGRKLTAQWNEAFGKGGCHLSPCKTIFLILNRPPKGGKVLQLANTQTEGRTMEVRNHQAVSRSIGTISLDLRAKLKRDFKNSLDNTRRNFSMRLQRFLIWTKACY